MSSAYSGGSPSATWSFQSACASTSRIDAAQRVRALAHGKEITLFALTGWGQEHDRQRTREAGFDGHLLKPIDPAVLEKLLARPAPRGDS